MEAGDKRGEHLHMSHTRSSVTSAIQHHQPPAVRSQRRLHQLSVHPPQPIPMLGHHRDHRGSANSTCQQSPSLN
jgi:hypothetical protein